MSAPLRFLVAESEPPQARAKRRASVGKSSGESFVSTLKALAPGAVVTRATPADGDGGDPDACRIAGFDAVFLSGSPLHLYEEGPETRREVAFMRAVFASGTPAFGSCAGLQVATVAAGGSVRAMGERREVGFARRIVPSEVGRHHPLLAGRPASFDAPAVHGDEVERLPDGAVLLAGNTVTRVQAAEIRFDRGVFWGVQYHPELTLEEIAAALRRQADSIVESGLARAVPEVEAQAVLVEALGRDPARRDLAWRLGLDAEVTSFERRTAELRNFIERLVIPVREARRRAGGRSSAAA